MHPLARETFCTGRPILRKYKRFRFHKTRASLFLRQLARDNAELFVHWQLFGTTTFT